MHICVSVTNACSTLPHPAGDQGRAPFGQKDGGQTRLPLVMMKSFLKALTSADKDGNCNIKSS